MKEILYGCALCGLKFPFNWLFPSAGEIDRKKVLQETQWGLASGDPRIMDALGRVATPGREGHDLTNLPIEVMRWGFKTWELDHPEGPMLGAWMVKAICALWVWSTIILLVALAAAIIWRRL